MSKRISNTAALNRAAKEAREAGASYGEMQTQKYLADNAPDRSILHKMQPIYEPAFDEYVCPKCAHLVVPRKNCGHCGKELLWKAGVK